MGEHASDAHPSPSIVYMGGEGGRRGLVMRRQKAIVIGLLILMLVACSRSRNGASSAETLPFEGDALEYHNRLRGMWLGSTIANWTGLTTEGVRNEPPFYTDEEWGTFQPVRWSDEPFEIDFVFQDPWLADDDTDIEYVYLHLMDRHGTVFLTPEQISTGWQDHINHHIWVSNQTARSLMKINGQPPVTSMLTVNPDSLAIDAQLTTEVFGAMAPGMPGLALDLADYPIRTTASGYSAHAAQYYVVLYALASQVDPSLEPRDQVIWLVEEARKYIPDSSKSADVVDYVLADYLNNPDPDNWELTRDRVYDRYHFRATANGWVYRDWIESTVNFAAGLIALLYGEGDFQRTVQIGTLTGWDSDNGTSTMGGLLGLMFGYDALVAQFPEQTISDRYHIYRTRDDLPDYLESDRKAEDTFALMSARMIPLIEAGIGAAGGQVDNGVWQLAADHRPPLDQNPLYRIYMHSINNQLPLQGGQVLATIDGSLIGTADLVDGLEFDYSGREIFFIPEPLTIENNGEPIEIEILYDQPVELSGVRLVEGETGGFESLEIELIRGENRVAADLNTALSSSIDPEIRYQLLNFVLNTPSEVDGFKLTGTLPDSEDEIKLLEIDGVTRQLQDEEN